MAMERDYTKEIQRVRDVQEKCMAGEKKILSYYCTCILKLYRAYYQAQQTEMLAYIRQIMDSAFPLVMDYFADRAEACLAAESAQLQSQILSDIEESIVEFEGMFDAIIHSTNNVSRILFLSASIDPATRCIAPKLYAYFSTMLNSLTAFLTESGPENLRYGFCVYPTLNISAEARILFSTMKKPGKVCTIRIPALQTTDIQKLRIYLCHEVYHITPGENMRFRRERAGIYARIFLEDVSAQLLSGCDFSVYRGMNGKKVRDMKDAVKEYLFGGVKECLNGLAGNPPDDRAFYSSELKETVTRRVLQYCQENIKWEPQELFNRIYRQHGFLQDYERYEELQMKVQEWLGQIRTNLFHCISDGELTGVSDFYMDMFREVYADLFTVITLRLTKEEYYHAVAAGGSGLGTAEPGQNLYLCFRLYLTGKTMERLIEKGAYSGKTEEEKRIAATWMSKMSGDSGMVSAVGELAARIEAKNEKADSRPDTGDPADDPASACKNRYPVYLSRFAVKEYVDYFEKCCGAFLAFIDARGEAFQNLSERFFLDAKDGFTEKICLRDWEKTDWEKTTAAERDEMRQN